MGLVHIYCGDGKGKTSAAVGLAVRAAGRGMQVVMVRFLKTDDSGEIFALKQIPGIHVLPCEVSYGFVRSMDSRARRLAAEYCQKQLHNAVLSASQADVLILDEVTAAVRYGMVSEERVLSVIQNRPPFQEIVMTGREPSPRLLAAADYISEIRKEKHPYNAGILARKGIEY